MTAQDLPVWKATPIPEDKELTQSAIDGARQKSVDEFDLDPARQRREKRRRQKQWSDGVIGMTKLSEGRRQELEELAATRLNARRPLRRQSNTDSLFQTAIPKPHQVDAHVKEEHGPESWRFRIIQFLHQRKVRNFFMMLLIADVIVLFVEVTLLAVYPHCDIIQRDAISCIPAEDPNDPNNLYKSGYCTGGSTDNSQELFIPQPNYPVGCDPHKWHGVHLTEEVLFVITMIILSCFFLELNVVLFVLGPKVFFRQVFYLVDYLIIGISITLELFFHLAHKDLTSSLFGLLVLFRAWRYVRISHGIVEVAAELADQEFGKLLNYTEQLEALVQAEGLELPSDSKVDKLRAEKEPQLVAQVRRHHAEEKRQQEQQTNGEEEEDAA